LALFHNPYKPVKERRRQHLAYRVDADTAGLAFGLGFAALTETDASGVLVFRLPKNLIDPLTQLLDGRPARRFMALIHCRQQAGGLRRVLSGKVGHDAVVGA